MSFQFFTQLFKRNETFDPQITNSLVQLATTTGINRRRNVRVKYPKQGAIGALPSVYFQGVHMLVENISIGGLCMVDLDNRMGEKVGAGCTVTLKWHDHKVEQKANIVGVNTSKRHLQFVDLSVDTLVRLTRLLKPGFLGNRFHRVVDPENYIELIAEELWIGPTGESLCFLPKSRETVLADFKYGRYSIRVFDSGECAFKSAGHGARVGQVIPVPLQQDILVCMGNFEYPTFRIESLIHLVNDNLGQRVEKEKP